MKTNIHLEDNLLEPTIFLYSNTKQTKDEPMAPRVKNNRAHTNKGTYIKTTIAKHSCANLEEDRGSRQPGKSQMAIGILGSRSKSIGPKRLFEGGLCGPL